MIVRELTDGDLPSLLAIHNDAVANTTAIWDEAPTDLASRRHWLDSHRRAGYPALACELDGTLLGYASFGDFRARSGYRHTVEHSVYVSRDHRRRGVARLLLGALIKRAQTLGKHAMVGGIEAGNTASLALHAAMGFEVCGRLPQVGAKFGRWLDLVFVQRLLDRMPVPPSKDGCGAMAVNTAPLEIHLADLDDRRIVELLATHLSTMRAQSPAESVHALDLEQLRTPELSIWAVWSGGELQAVGALKRLSAAHGEIKSMHTRTSARRRGIAGALLAHLFGTARAEGLSRLSLETGSQPDFGPARALYTRHGFNECGPFADYRPDPDSVFMTLELSAVAMAVAVAE